MVTLAVCVQQGQLDETNVGTAILWLTHCKAVKLLSCPTRSTEFYPVLLARRVFVVVHRFLPRTRLAVTCWVAPVIFFEMPCSSPLLLQI